MMRPFITQLLRLATAVTVVGCAVDTATPGECLFCSTRQETSGVTADGGVLTGDPAARASEATACAAWQSVRERCLQSATWTPGTEQCDLGSLPAPTEAASVEWLNYFRVMVGLAPVREDPSERTPAQACAVLLERNGQLTHTPPTTWTCANAMGRSAAGRSNLSGNPGFPMSPWYAVRGWIDEGRDLSNTLGHRRWLLSPELHTVSYGQTGSFACMTLGLGARDPSAPAWVAWPPAGWVPTALIGTIWSFSKPGLAAAGTRVRVFRNGTEMTVNATMRQAGLGDETISWEVATVAAGSVYRVQVALAGQRSVEYEVRPTGCSLR